jgi:hypothetical protein
MLQRTVIGMNRKPWPLQYFPPGHVKGRRKNLEKARPRKESQLCATTTTLRLHALLEVMCACAELDEQYHLQKKMYYQTLQKRDC